MHTWALLRVLEEEESESHDGGAADVVVDVAHRHVQQLPDGVVGTRPAVSLMLQFIYLYN